MTFEDMLHTRRVMLAEGSVYERIRRDAGVEYDPYLSHAALVYDPHARSILGRIHREYFDIARRYRLPLFALTDTWRANAERIARSKFHRHDVNTACVDFLLALRAEYGARDAPIFVGGLTGCRGDAYAPDRALPRREARSFHAPQIRILSRSGVDFLMAATLPALSEAHGIADAMAETALPYILSFVVRTDGTLLDGTPLHRVIETVDTTVSRPPACYMVNCVHPGVFGSALEHVRRRAAPALGRIRGLQANTSARSPEELDGLPELETEDPEVFAGLMGRVCERYDLRILGGCCGTDASHIASLAAKIAESREQKRVERSRHET